MPADHIAQLRAAFAHDIAAQGAAKDPRIAAAFAAVPREIFAGPAPWSIVGAAGGYVQTLDDDPAHLYQDILVALDPNRGINIGQPSLHARCLDALALQPGETVLQVGAGSGYYTAILAHLVRASGQVHASEINPNLADRASQNLQSYAWVTIHGRSGTLEGLPSVDAIYVNAGVTQPSPVWLDALRPGGRLLFPLQAVKSFGGMLLINKPPNPTQTYPARFVSRASFIPCDTIQNEVAGQALVAAFAGGGWEAVKTLRLDGKPDETCWVDGGGWWLSTSGA